MTKKVVAIERGLDGIREALERRGCQIVGLDTDLKKVDAVVVRGTDANLAGREDILTKAPVIEAKGRNEQEILRELEERWRE